MAKTKISEYSSTANNNSDIGSVNIAEGCAPSGINNAIRILMSQLKNFQDGSAGDNVTVGGNLYVTGTTTNTGAITASGGISGNITSSSATITGGTINGAVIGGSSAQAITGTNVTATVGFTGPLTGNVTGNTTGTHTGAVTGNVTGNVTGDVTGNVSAASGTSTFNNVTINGTLDMNSGTTGTITGLATPTGDTDAATKGYVDALAQGIDAKASVVVATTANITLSGTQTIDGIAVSVGDRVLVKDQTTQSQNGIYLVASSSWTRATDADTWTELVAAFTFVESGTTQANNGYICTVTAGGTIGTTAVTFAQFSGAGQITAGAGLVKSGNTLNVQTASTSRIVVGSDEIDLASTGVSAGTYKSVTTDVYGRITAGTNPTTLSGFGITDTYTSSQIDTLFGSTSSAATSAAAAATSASNAATSATNASTSAGNASSSATAAAASATSAANSYTTFNNQYLGNKSTAPTVNNSGGALVAGNLYWNTAVNTLYVWTGSTWTQAAFTSGGFLVNSNNLSDVSNANYALTNLTGYTTTATAAGTTTLTNASTFYQLFTGTANQTVQLPVTSTLRTGWSFHICNNSTGTLTVNSSGSNLVITVPSQVTAMVTCIGTTLTTAADWESGLTDFSTSTGSGSVVLSTSPTIAGTLTLSGSSSTSSAVLPNAAEVSTVSATAATGTINYDITTQSVLYYTSNASANWTVNFRGSSGTSLNTLMSTGQSMTVAFLVTQGSTAYYNNVVQVDGTTTGVTTRWLGGAPTAGNASGIDSYRYLIIKTGSATFTVLASNTQFKA